MANELLKAKVVAGTNDDPSTMGRVQVYIPSYHGEFNQSMVGNNEGDSKDTPNSRYPWATFIATESSKEAPEVGSIVLIGFLGNDPSSPIIMGLYSSSNGAALDGGFAGGSLAEIAASIIFGNEGGYNSVNWNDNGAISIGKIQWHADNAKNLLIRIRNMNQNNFDNLASGTDIVSSLDKSWASWTKWNSTCPSGSALKNKILTSNESKSVQDASAIEYVQGYIDNINKNGVTDPKCVVYLADIANQGPAIAYAIARYASSNNISNLDQLHNAVLSGKPKVYGCINDTTTYINRRKNTYSKIMQVDQQGKFVTNGLSGMIGTSGSGEMAWPVPTVSYVSSGFVTYRCVKNSAGKVISEGSHPGIDIAGPYNSKIYAAHDGKVVTSGWSSSFGNWVVLQGSTYSTIYCHMNAASPIKAGSTISRGTYLGPMGSTGNSTGSHLHFGVYKGAYQGYRINAVDPLTLMQKPS